MRKSPLTSIVVSASSLFAPVHRAHACSQARKAGEASLHSHSSAEMGRPRGRKRRAATAEDELEEPALFPVGAEVEVRIDDQGFAGSFYEATVEAHLPGTGRAAPGYVVAYATLTRREGGGSPHRERVTAADVRPRPPAAAAWRDGFAVHETVEAFHNEGWWAGVVVRRVEEDGGEEGTTPRRRRVYTVCFPTTREVLDFDEACLRPRLVFRRQRWVPAAEAENRSPMFREGSQVEVSRSPNTFGQYWSPATVLKVIDATSFLVQYGDTTEDGELVTEIMDAQYIRPGRDNSRMDCRHRFPPASFVEVFYESSWWPGVVLKVSDDKFVKKYVVKIRSHETAMDNVECVDVLTVEHTHLRPRFDWHGRKWVRCLTEKQFNRGPQSTSSKRKISCTVQSSNDIDNSAASASSIDSDEITEESAFSNKKKMNNADAVLEAVCPEFSMCDENVQIKHKLSSDPEETGKQQNSVLPSSSPLVLPSQLSISGFCHLKYDPKRFLSNQHQLQCTQMISIPSVPHTGQLQASLFGAFGQLRPLPQGPVLGIQSLNPDFASIGASKKAFTLQEKQPTDKGYYLMADPQQKNNALSVGTALYRKRKVCISSQTPVELGENPEIVLPKKRIVDKNAEGTSKVISSSEEQLKLKNDYDKHLPYDKNAEGTSQVISSSEEQLKLKNDYDKHLPYDATHHSGILPETVASIHSTPLKGNQGLQKRSVFLRESSVVDEIIPSGIPIGTDELHHGGHVGALRVGATKVSILSEHSVCSVVTLDKSSDANVLLSNSFTQQNKNKATETVISEIIMEQEAVEDASVDLLPSAKGCKVTRDDHKDNIADLAQLHTTCGVPTDNVCTMALAMSGDVVPNFLPSGESCEANKKVDVGVEDRHGNRMELPNIMPETIKQSSKNSAASEHGMPHLDCSSPMVGFAAECSQSTSKSALTQLSSADMSNSTESEHGNRLIEPKDAEGTPMSKYVTSRIRDCCGPLLQRSVAVHKRILAGNKPSESLAVDNLPFVKTSPMWAQIEAMDVFSKMPQRPHFHQFQQHVPEVREGMALGLMLSFANLVESIQQLNLHDENALFEEKMKGLSSLEAHGFDVTHLQSHLEKLLDIKNGRAELQDGIKKLEEKIVHEESVDRQLGAQIGMLNSIIRQLDLHAHLLRGLTQSVVSQKINCGVEISRLKAEAGELKYLYLCAEERFAGASQHPGTLLHESVYAVVRE